MRYPLISLSRHTCRVVLMDGDEPGELERALHGLVARRFASHEAALAYLRFWRGDAGAMGDLRHALLRSGTLPADIAVFDPQDFRDRATYREPHQYPTGARTHVIVNGTLVVENATHTEALPGKVLRRDKAGAVS